MTRCVQLRELPDGFQFPDELQDRISFDPEKHQLVFDGFMSKKDFDRLVQLHNDISYQRALEELFQTCTFTESTTSRRLTLSLIAAGVGLAVVVTLVVLVTR